MAKDIYIGTIYAGHDFDRVVRQAVFASPQKADEFFNPVVEQLNRDVEPIFGQPYRLEVIQREYHE